jgi:hypothetical protein
MRELLRTAHLTIRLDDATKVVRLVRSAVPFDDIREIDANFLRITALFTDEQRAELKILLDVRDAPSRNDPEFENALQRRTLAFYRGFLRAAVLLRTAAGKLQLARMARAVPSPAPIFDDEHKALVYLQTGLGAP